MQTEQLILVETFCNCHNVTFSFMRSLEENGLIEINSTTAGDELNITVKDRGIGISKEDQQHLFERFFRGTNAANIQGTGLGLHIVSKYIELMDGQISYNSELEKGTEFVIKFTLL